MVISSAPRLNPDPFKEIVPSFDGIFNSIPLFAGLAVTLKNKCHFWLRPGIHALVYHWYKWIPKSKNIWKRNILHLDLNH